MTEGSRNVDIIFLHIFLHILKIKFTSLLLVGTCDFNTNPTINRQDTGITRTLKLFSDDRSNHEPNLSNIRNIRATPQERQINSVIEQNLIRNN